MNFLTLLKKLFFCVFLISSQALALSYEEVIRQLYSEAQVHPRNPEVKVLNQMNSPLMIHLIDKSILSLIETDTGRKICKEFSNGNEVLSYFALGISSQSVEKVKSKCSGWNFLGGLFSKERFIVGLVTPRPGKYVFHFTKFKL